MDMNRCGLALAGALTFLASSAAFAQNATVRGTVTNAQGAALANAEVTLRALPPPGMPARMPNMPGMNTAERTTRSGADGTFAFGPVRPGPYVLLVDCAGFERSSQEVTVATQPQTVAVRLGPLVVPGAESAAPAAAGGSAAEVQALLDRIKTLEQRLTDLESTAV